MMMCVEYYMEEAEKNLELAFLTTAFEELEKEIRNYPDEELPRTLEELMLVGPQGYRDSVKHRAKRLRFIWASKYCLEKVSERI